MKVVGETDLIERFKFEFERVGLLFSGKSNCS